MDGAQEFIKEIQMTNLNTVLSPTSNDVKKFPQVSDAVALRLDPSESGSVPDTCAPLDPTPTHIVKISYGGMRFLHESAMDANDNVYLSLYLPLADQTVQLNSRVVSCGEEKTPSARRYHKPYFVQVEFQNIDEHVHQLLKNHINDVLAKTGNEQISCIYN